MVLAVISLLNGSLTWNTEDVRDSGGADAMATTIDSPRKTIAKPIASNRKEFALVLYPEFLVLAKAITRRGTTTLFPALADSSVTADV